MATRSRGPAPRRRPVRAPKPIAPPAPGLRGAVERRSVDVLTRLHRQPRFMLPLLTAVLLVGGLAAGGPLGALCLLPVLLVVGWLSYLSWPRLALPARLLRMVLLGLLVTLVTTEALAPLA